MKNKVLATMFLIGICLACCPALYACESCIAKGNTGPAGEISVDWNRCYAWDSGSFESCYIDSKTKECVMSDTDPNACPISSGSPGSGSGGGGFYDLSEGSYDPGSGGYCSAEYASCH